MSKKRNGLYSTKLVKKNVLPGAKMYSLPLYPLHHCLNCGEDGVGVGVGGGYHGDTEGSFLIGCPDEVRVTRKVETRRCWG